MRRIDFTYRNFYRLIRNERGFSIDFDPCTRQPDSFHEELCRAARHISSLATGKIYLMYSGGIDSEYVLDVYPKLGIEVVPVIVRLLPDYNSHDLEYAIKYCRAKGLDPIFIDIDFDDFVRSGKMLETMMETECGYYQLSSTMYAAAQLDGTILIAGGDHYCSLDTQTGQWNFEEFEIYRSWDIWFDIKNKNGTSMLLGYTPEMMLAFLTDPDIVDVVNNRVPGKLGTFSSRIKVYNK